MNEQDEKKELVEVSSTDLGIVFERALVNVLDALLCSLLVIEAGCHQLDSAIRLQHFDDAVSVARRTVNMLLVGSAVYRRVAVGLRDVNASASALVPIKERIDAAQVMAIVLLERARADGASPEICQLMDDLRSAIDTLGNGL
ncbi:MAG TPA: hypothetical protein VH165_06525 [Kofleriaceae bacterium]|jgi:hypothetical protein|nr:hypothetical protein [Kofleriaceae bacterium]